MNKINTIRHSLSHILAAAVQKKFPDVKFGTGPAIKNGFYYDFDNLKINQEDLLILENLMKKLIKQNLKFSKKVISKEKAKKIFKNQPYKLELLSKIKDKKVCVYQVGEFVDLCSGPHIKSTKQIDPESFKLVKIAGAYWQGDEKKPMLTRIYGVAFKTKKELKDYLRIQKELQKRDHRILGEKLGIFLLENQVGQGLPLWLPKGETLRKTVENYLYQELSSAGYQWVTTPHIGKLDLWKTSGHWDLYRENMYAPLEIEGEKYLLKPMNCPFHVKIYKSKIRSYKELPLKLAEFGTVYRYERSGTLHGLTRVRGFTQDDAHIWCTKEQLIGEVEKLLKQGLKILKTFGFKEFKIYLSTRPEKYAGTLKDWQKATDCLKYVLKKLKLDYQIDKGGGVFYGPKIDIKIKDSLEREWQCTTIQIDFNLPERFDINFINKKGRKERPFMIHRALIGSLERFIGVLIEHYGGALPLWLSPSQIWVIAIGTKHQTYAKQIIQKLKSEGFRVEGKFESETVSKKIREGEIQKIPYILVIGDKEKKQKTIRVRKRGKGDIGEMKLVKFLELISKELKKKI